MNMIDIGISAQVLQEFFVAATRKQRLNISVSEAGEMIAAMREFPVLPVTPELVERAIANKSAEK